MVSEPITENHKTSKRNSEKTKNLPKWHSLIYGILAKNKDVAPQRQIQYHLRNYFFLLPKYASISTNPKALKVMFLVKPPLRAIATP